VVLLASRVLGDAVECHGVAITKRSSNLVDLVGLRIECATRNQEDSFSIKSCHLVAESFSRGLAIDYPIGCRVVMNSVFAHLLSRFQNSDEKCI
jgi:hypothetical protein